jgi:penicillin amidase/acyl-homoserine-lactone acylase
MREQAKRVTILRDKWGIPHIFGESDADAAFGLAYAHAQDDFPTTQLVLAASTGRLSLLKPSKMAIGNDFYVGLIRVQQQVKELYKKLHPKTRLLLEGYASGFNYYAALHPKEADGRLFPVRGEDIAAGFIHKIPLMFDFPRVLGALNNATEKKIGDAVLSEKEIPSPQALASQWPQLFRIIGSNTHALSKERSTDDTTRLNVNSHQPWEGPVTWYEAHISSKEGWNMLGGTFPGAPLILHGHNDHLGWAHTNNFPDLIDVYKLVMHPTNPLQYKLDGQWKTLEVQDIPISIELGFFTYTHKMVGYWSEHGPVFKAKHGYYAIRYAGIGKAIFAVEQWYRMNKARSFKEWKEAMRQHALPMFNTGYADRENIFYVYNALLPIRKKGYDYKKILPGDRSEAIWKSYLPWEQLPQIHNPPSGFVQNCNASPFHATSGLGAPNPAQYPAETGIERYQNNRSLRSLRLLSGSKKLSREDFLAMKFDRQHDKDAPLYRDVLNPLFQGFSPQSEDEKKGIDLLKAWDGKAESESTAATLALLTRHPLKERSRKGQPHEPKTPAEAYRAAIAFLKRHYGRIDIPLAQIQRLRRGSIDLPINGAPDTITSVHSRLEGDKLIGYQGDSYILLVEFTPQGIRSFSRHQYGNINRRHSPHYADQALDFTKRTLKPIHRDRDILEKEKTASYHPGEEK